jgi:hypothetical protein
MEFFYGAIATILIILFLVWGFFSVLGNERNPASYFVGALMTLFTGQPDSRYGWLVILLVGLGALVTYYFTYLKH